MIELTEQQRQALQSAPGSAVDVVDSTTQRRYVLVALEQFEWMKSLVTRSDQNGSTTAEQSQRGTFSADPGPLRIKVRELPLPPELAEELRHCCRELHIRRKEEIQQEEDQLKLQHFYGGKWIAVLRSDEGPVVVAAATSLSDPLFDFHLSQLTPDERRQAHIDSPLRLFDDESQVLTTISEWPSG